MLCTVVNRGRPPFRFQKENGTHRYGKEQKKRFNGLSIFSDFQNKRNMFHQANLTKSLFS